MDDEAWRLAHELAETPDRRTFLRMSTLRLSEVVGGDCFWMETDFASGSCLVWRPGEDAPDPVLGARLAAAPDHPAILSYLDAPHDLTPRRLSDVTDRGGWRRTAAFDALAEGVGRHQLSMVTWLAPPAVGHGWSIGRNAGDFKDKDLETACRLLPVLHALERSYSRRNVTRSEPDDAPEDRPDPLTGAEHEILSLLAQGLTADAIGRRRGISGRTVRKHLEHIYAKLGSHDRLLAVDHARDLGLLVD
jgi:DNA-binding CsgD family transcriptional regulator